MLKNDRPIGVFDSGLGGLTVLTAIMKLMPNEHTIYFGDTAHVPYGSKSREVVTGFSLAIADFLMKHKVKMIVVACNTASAFALDELRKQFDVPIIGVIDPGAKAALGATLSGRIGVIGTEGTVRSDSYSTAITALNRKAKIFSKACPLFVPLVEEGWLNHAVTRSVAEEYIKPLRGKEVDTLVLGCTHYPLIKQVLRAVAGPSIKLIDSAEATANEVQETLAQLNLARTQKAKGACQLFVSDIPQKFEEIGRRFLGRSMKSVKKVSLD